MPVCPVPVVPREDFSPRFPPPSWSTRNHLMLFFKTNTCESEGRITMSTSYRKWLVEEFMNTHQRNFETVEQLLKFSMWRQDVSSMRGTKNVVWATVSPEILTMLGTEQASANRHWINEYMGDNALLNFLFAWSKWSLSFRKFSRLTQCYILKRRIHFCWRY